MFFDRIKEKARTIVNTSKEQHEEDRPSKELVIKGETLLAEQIGQANSVLANLAAKDYLDFELLIKKTNGLPLDVVEIFWEQICKKFLTSYKSSLQFSYSGIYSYFSHSLKFTNNTILREIFVNPDNFYKSLNPDSQDKLRQLLLVVIGLDGDILLNKILDQMAFFNSNDSKTKQSVSLVKKVFETDNFFVSCLDKTGYNASNECRNCLISIYEKFDLKINFNIDFAIKFAISSTNNNNLNALKFIFKIYPYEKLLAQGLDASDGMKNILPKRPEDIVLFLAEKGIKHSLWELAESHILPPMLEQQNLLQARIKELEDKVKQLETELSYRSENKGPR